MFAALAFAVLTGCAPSEPSSADEEKEPHFVLGNNRFNSLDYDGAIEAFQAALEVNPRSAQAHYRLAQLFDTKHPDPAAAIFHYQEFLRLNPQAENIEVIHQRIVTCKQQLAADVLAMPSAPAAMRHLEDMTETNRLLQSKIEQLTAQVKQWSDYATSLQAAAKNNPPPNNPAPQNAGSALPDDMSTPSGNPPPPVSRSEPPTPPHIAKAKTHVVAAGETMASIARKHGVSLSALQAANPGVTPKKIRVGQTLNLP
jgi:tetratricopeptide (TPR) repeat protein